ncbi:MAG: hypothetical protein NUV53_02300 [Patescibacteria group bacterium]|nr:hypothetical protein [Patescibacteria group bacterium]
MDSKKAHYIIATLVIIVVAILAVWYVVSQTGSVSEEPNATPVTQVEDTSAVPVVEVSTSSLGASLLEKAQNTIQDKVIEVSAPTANPIEGAYKNPFE